MANKAVIAKGLKILEEFGYIKVGLPSDDPADPKIGTVNLWHGALFNLSDEQVNAGFKYLFENWRPKFYGNEVTVAELRAFVNQASLPDWSEAFKEIEAKKYRMLNQVFDPELNYDPWENGGDMSPFKPSWSHPAIGEVVQQMGGLKVFLELETKNENTFRAQFRDVYGNITKRQQTEHISVPQLQQPDAPGVALIAEARARKQQREGHVKTLAEVKDDRVREIFQQTRDKMLASRQMPQLTSEKISDGKSKAAAMLDLLARAEELAKEVSADIASLESAPEVKEA